MASGSSQSLAECPVCFKSFASDLIEAHVNLCFEKQSQKILSSPAQNNKRQSDVKTFGVFNCAKKPKIQEKINDQEAIEEIKEPVIKSKLELPTPPLAEALRADNFDDYVGQEKVVGKNSIIRNLLESNNIPSMIFWGPPGCGKTTLAHIIWNHCNNDKEKFRFVQLSACTSGINDVKEAVKQAKTLKDTLRRRTILFMDEIHRFNKLQQDAFLPHVENGTIVLIGASTENPSFSLNSALLSRCRVIVLEKLESSNILEILRRALPIFKAVEMTLESIKDLTFTAELGITEECLQWIADISDGDARIALNR